MAHLDLVDLGKRYGETIAIAGVTLTIERGSFVSLLGPSGCGKTTTLRMVAGFIAPDAGTIRLDGRAIERDPPHRRNIGMVFQSYALFPHLSVSGNVEFGLRMRGLAPAERDARVADAIAAVGLSGLEARYPAQLSGGQQQRVALARALVIRPDVLLLDEPLSNLDASLRSEMRREIRALQRRHAITTLFVTHDQEEALSLSDRVVVMEKGRVIEDATPAELSESPKRLFSARFLGARTVLAGKVENGIFRAGALRAALPPSASGQATHVVLRAARLRWSRDGAEDTALAARGRVTDVSYLGDAWDIHVDIGGADIRMLRPSGETPPLPGEEIQLGATPDALGFLVEPTPHTGGTS